MEYSKVIIDLFCKFKKAPVDVYVSLSPEKFIKVIHEGSSEGKDIAEKYAKKGVNFFYVRAEDYDAVTKGLSELFRSKLAKSDKLPLSTNMDTVHDSFQLITEEFRANGTLTESLEKLLKASIDSVVLDVKKEPTLSNILNAFLGRNDFITDHSLMLSYVSGLAAVQMDWRAEETLKKMAMASLFHDMSLVSEQNAMITSSRDLNELDESRKSTVTNHCFVSAKMISKLNNIPLDIDQMISHHHEIPGHGFPGRVSSSSITQISALFAICEEFVTDYYYKINDERFIELAVKEYQIRYNTGNFKAPIKGLIKMLKPSL